MQGKENNTFSHFRVISTLKPHLDTLPEAHARELARFLSLFISLQRRNKCRNVFINVSSRYLKSISVHYRKRLEELQRLGVLEINETYSKENHFTKSYMVRDLRYLSTEVVYFKSRKPVIKPNTKQARRVTGGECERITAEVLDRNLTVNWDERPEFLSPHTEHALKRIGNGRANVSRKRANGRLTHSLLQVSKQARYMVKHKAGLDMIELDAVACWANLLRHYTTGAERAAYQSLLTGDFYKNLIPLLDAKRTRGQVKRSFAAYCSGGAKCCLNPVFRFFAARFPKLHAKVLTGMGAELQSLESRLFVDAMVKECHALGLLYVPMHDGCYCGKSQINTITSLLNKNSQEIIGYSIPIKLTPILQPKRHNPATANVAMNCTYHQPASEPNASEDNFKSNGVSIAVQTDTWVSIRAEFTAVQARRAAASEMMGEAIAAHRRLAPKSGAERKREGYRRFVEAKARGYVRLLDSIWEGGADISDDVI